MAGGAGYQDEDGGMITDINVTPLVDITLVILIVFMITVPTIVVNRAIKVDLPKTTAGDEMPKQILNLAMQKKPEGGYLLAADGDLISEDRLRTLIPELLKRNTDLHVVVAADKGIAYGDVVRLVATVKGMGVKKFALNTDAAP